MITSNPRNYTAAYHQILEPGPLVPKKIKNLKKLQFFLKIA